MPVITEQDFDCTPSSLLASTPCLNCLSDKEMLAALLGILALNQDLLIADVLKDSACYTCMSKHQMLQAFVTIMGNSLLGEGDSPQTVVDNIRCLECASEKQLLAAILYLMCKVFKIQAQ